MRTPTIAAVALAFIGGLLVRQVLATEMFANGGEWWNALPTMTFANGAWWNSLPAAVKHDVVKGMVASFQRGFEDGKESSEAYLQTQTKSNIGTPLNHGMLNLPIPMFSETTDNYVAKVDKFYAKNSDVADKVSVANVLGCMIDNNANTECVSTYADLAHKKPRPSPKYIN